MWDGTALLRSQLYCARVEPKVAAFGKKWETQPFKSYPNAKASCSGEHLDLDTVLYSCMSVLYRTVQYEC